MRILHVLDEPLPGHGSYAARSSAVLREQRALGWQTLHLLSPSASQQTPQHCGLSFYRCAARPSYLPATFGNLWSLQRQLRRVGRLSRPDLIQVHSPAYLGLAAMRRSCPLLLEVRGLFPERADILERLLLPRLSGIVCTSYALARKLESLCRPGLPIAVVPNGVHPGPAQGTRRAADFRQRHGLGQPLLGLLGPCSEAEGCALALQALARLHTTFPEICLIFAGKHAAHPYWRELAKQLGVSRHFHAVEAPSAAWLGACYAELDLLLYPRLSSPESELLLPTRALEAMQSGCLIAASDVGGHRELFEQGQSAFLFPTGDLNALVQAIRLLMQSPAAWHGLRSHARKHVEQQYSWQQVCRAYVPIINLLTGKPSARH